jgi:hypothetical protein
MVVYNTIMTATAHALVSGAIAASIHQPELALPLAFASHFFMDTVPHWDFGTNWRGRSKAITGAIAIADTLLGFTVAYFLFRGKVSIPVLFAAVSLGNLPDWMEAPYYIFFARPDKKTLTKESGFWETLTYKIYRAENVFHTKAQAPLGIITQVVTVAFFMLLLMKTG